MIELYITKTTKSYDPKDQYRIYDIERKSFESVQEAEKWIKKTYGNSKRHPMYQDNVNGQIGYIIGFKNSEYNDGNLFNFLEQHWIEFRKTETLVIKGMKK